MAAINPKMATDIESAHRHLQAALAEFAPMERMTATDSYVMGHVRCCLAVTESAMEFIQQHLAMQTVKPARKQVPPK